AYVANDPVNGRDPSGKNSYYVSRPVTELGIDTGYDHTFIIIADKVGGPVKAYFDFGPEKGGAINTIMNKNGKLVSTNLTSTDLAAWQAPDKRQAGITVSVVPASDKSVISAGNSLVKSLGTASNPGNVGYTHSPNGLSASGNSNSASSTIVNNAVQTERPGSPTVVPPSGDRAIGSNTRITSPNCVSGPSGASCNL
ncbi:hypothetical protein, partial [Sphingomonas sanguinis]|uniref:hypothetical protein n=1 Tax=Sphingomonas sanguinis TaxID=33051 RepID=UPI0019D35E32